MSTDSRENHINYVEVPAHSAQAFASVKQFYKEVFGACQCPVTPLMRTYRPICGIGSRLGEANFRFARQPPTIVTWAELDFYDLPLIRPSGFVNSGRQSFSNQELGELRMDRRGYGNSSEAIACLLSTE